MLEACGIGLVVENGSESVTLLDGISFCVPRGHFMAIVGPSGCGKTTLLKAIAGIKDVTDGCFRWMNRELSEEYDFAPHEIGYVPQFSIAYEELTVDESVESAARLRLRGSEDELDDAIDRALEETGLAEIADRTVKLLSGGQRRRLSLAMELVSRPRLLLCDEVTSGLDPRSEQEIVNLLRELSLKDGLIVISVTHSLSQLDCYDSVLVMNGGRLAYHGSPRTLAHYFSVSDVEEVYPRLNFRDAGEWADSWLKHRVAYYERLEKEHRAKLSADSDRLPDWMKSPDSSEEKEEAPLVPGFFSQFWSLLARRFTILFRDRAQLTLQLIMILIFPVMVALFSNKGQEQLMQLTDVRGDDIAMEVQYRQQQAEARAKVGSAVSGIIMFEVILLGLLGASNDSREEASERLILEKEKMSGLSPGAYLASKAAYMSVLVLAQSLWMFSFVEWFWPLRGELGNHLAFLLLANAAMSSVCLAVSAHCKTADQSSLLCIYLVGFQLPLSGAVLALPTAVEKFVQPFISAYWAWSGSVGGLEAEVLKAVVSIVQTSFAPSGLCLVVLAVHVLAGLGAAYWGVRRNRWE